MTTSLAGIVTTFPVGFFGTYLSFFVKRTFALLCIDLGQKTSIILLIDVKVNNWLLKFIEQVGVVDGVPNNYKIGSI